MNRLEENDNSIECIINRRKREELLPFSLSLSSHIGEGRRACVQTREREKEKEMRSSDRSFSRHMDVLIDRPCHSLFSSLSLHQ